MKEPEVNAEEYVRKHPRTLAFACWSCGGRKLAPWDEVSKSFAKAEEIFASGQPMSLLCAPCLAGVNRGEVTAPPPASVQSDDAQARAVDAEHTATADAIAAAVVRPLAHLFVELRALLHDHVPDDSPIVQLIDWFDELSRGPMLNVFVKQAITMAMIKSPLAMPNEELESNARQLMTRLLVWIESFRDDNEDLVGDALRSAHKLIVAVMTFDPPTSTLPTPAAPIH